MRVLHVIGGLAPRYGGPSKVLPEMCAALAARGHHVEIFTTNVDGRLTLDVPLGVPVPLNGAIVWYFPVHRPRSYLASLPLAWGLRKRLAEFDVAHIHSLYLFHTLVACHECRRQGIPYILRPHGTLDPYHRSKRRMRKYIYDSLVERRNLDGAAAIHCTSEAESLHVKAAGVSAPCVVVPHGVDVGQFDDPRDSSLQANYPELVGRRWVTFLGRLAQKKGLEILIDGFADVARRVPDAMLVLSGPEDEVRKLTLLERARDAGCGDRVLVTGLLTGDAKAELLRRTTVFALPSADESFGVAVVEAMAAGVPVVITTGVALHREVTNASAGIVVERNPEGIARGLLDILEDPERGQRMGSHGRELARCSFSWALVARELERAYERIGGQGSGAASQRSQRTGG